MITPQDVDEAAARIEPYVRRTPVMPLHRSELGLPAGAPVLAKLELLQHTGSFKARPAFSLLTARNVPDAGVIAASGGNFGMAVAYAAQQLGHRATICVPRTTPEGKRALLDGYGADVVVVDGFYAEAFEESRRIQGETGALTAHAYDQPEVVAGGGTCGRELEEQAETLGGVDTVLVAVGGGGLIGGIATWLGDRVRVVGVETPGTAALTEARKVGGPVDVDVSGLAASSLGARRIGDLCWQAQERIAATVLVTDEAIEDAQRLLWRRVRTAAEPGGAVTVAALTSGAYRPGPDERVAVIVCGANVDLATLAGLVAG